MRGDLLDLALVLLGLAFAVAGYRQGFVVGVLSYGGFVVGGVLGAQLSPTIADALSTSDPAVTGLAVVLVSAILGQLIGTLIGGRLRERVTFHPAQVLDSAGGAAVSLVSLLLIAWLIGTAVATSPYTTLADQARRSAVIAATDQVIPGSVRNSLRDFRNLIDDRGFPDVFGGLTPSRPASAAPPDSALTKSAVVQQTRSRVLKVRSIARSCGRSIEGSGFVFAPERLMTNAHVVAGAGRVTVLVGGDSVDATVVVYDPQRDLAVLRVPGLSVAPLAFAPVAAEAGDSAIVLGYPRDGPYRADAARVRQTQRAKGPDIYGNRTVVREIYATRGTVQPGNSGGPLIDLHGRVLGVVFAAATDRADVGYVLTADEVAPVVTAGRTASAEVGTQGCD